LSLLQEAAGQAQTPNREPRSFRAERQAAHLDAPDFDSLVAGARALDPKHVFIPGASKLVAGMKTDLSAMLAPLPAADSEASRPFVGRTEALTKALPVAAGDRLDLADIDALASVDRTDRDSVHPPRHGSS